MENQLPPASNNQTPPAGPKESDIAQKAADQRPPVFNPLGRVEQLTPEETKIADIRRHPFGLFLIYLQGIGGLSVALFLIFVLIPGFVDAMGLNTGDAQALFVVFSFFAIVLDALFLILATRIYMGNQLIISDVNVTQVLQIGLFNRKISELSMANIEDVTAQQKGIFPTLFNFGTLVIETAGEQNNFIFPYCPNPNAYAKALLDARQRFITSHATRTH